MWNIGKPKRIKAGVLCDSFLAVDKFSDVASIEQFFYDEDEWLDYDGNTRRIRLWMEIPEIPSWRMENNNE